ncbi:hypothetical protein CAJAP_10308 [Camponotus japonicus]
MLMKRKFTSTLATNKMYKIDDLVKNTSTSTSRIYDPDFSAQETEQNNCSQCNVDFNDIEEIDDIILEKKNTSPELCKNVIPKGVPDKAMSNKENSSAAVQLMRENTEIKQERLRISKEKLLFEKEKFDYLKNFYFDCKNILSNVDYNIMRLREEVEKMAPSYLT